MSDSEKTTDRPNRRPVIGVGVVVWKDDRVLLVKRRKQPRLGQWSIPGGAQEWGEKVLEAARREVREETGLEIEFAGLIDIVDALMPANSALPEHHYTLIDFAAVWTSGTARPADDVAEVRWCNLSEIDRLVEWETTRNIIKSSRRLIGS